MKKAINSTRKITIVLITMFTLGLSPLTKGFSQAAYTSFKEESPAEFKFLNKVDSRPVFQLNMNNKEDDQFWVRVKDGDGKVLYSETLTGKNAWRQYLLDVSDDDFNDPEFKLRFEVKSLTTHRTFVYNVSRDTHVVSDISIAKS